MSVAPLFMMHLQGLVLFILSLAGAARRSIRIDDSHHDSQQQSSTLTKTFEMSAGGREAFLPTVLPTALFRRQGLQADTMQAGDRRRLHRRAPHGQPESTWHGGPGAWRSLPPHENHLRKQSAPPSTGLRVGPRRAMVDLRAQRAQGEDQEWAVATASPRTDQPVLSLVGVGLVDDFFDGLDRNSSGSTNYRQSIAINGNSQEDGTDASSSSSPYYYLQQQNPSERGYGPYIVLSPEERELFTFIRKAREESNLSTTFRVAGGWVRDKLLSTPQFAPAGAFSLVDDDGDGVTGAPQTLTSKCKPPSTSAISAGRLGANVRLGTDIDIALDDMLGQQFAELLNRYLSERGEKTYGVGVIQRNPDKSKHLETASMKVGTVWVDFVNLRGEEYTQHSRIPSVMRFGTPAEDAFRRDLTINSLFYNLNNGQVEDWTGRGLQDLSRCVIATPQAPLTTLLDDPLRVLRAVRFAARLRFAMDEALVDAARDARVRGALAEKVSRDRVGVEVDLMLRSPDPVRAMRLLVNFKLVSTVFPIEKLVGKTRVNGDTKNVVDESDLFERGLDLLSTNHNQMEHACWVFPPAWCTRSYLGSYTTHGMQDTPLWEDDDLVRYMWYAALFKPLYDYSLKNPDFNEKKRLGRKARRSTVSTLLFDELKRPTREVDAVEKIMKGANGFKSLMDKGYDSSAVFILLNDIRVYEEDCTGGSSSENPQGGMLKCSMDGQQVFTATEHDPAWQQAMEFRLSCSKVMREVGPLWRAALFLAMSEDITEALQSANVFLQSQERLRRRETERYYSLATAILQIGLVGIWGQKPRMDGGEIKRVLPNIPNGPVFQDVMQEQTKWMTLHPCAGADILARHLVQTFPDYAQKRPISNR